MQLTLAHVGPPPKSAAPLNGLTRGYLDRCSPFARCHEQAFASEAALLDWLDRKSGRTPATSVFFDSRGRQMTSEAFAKWVGEQRDRGAQHLVFAIGPADGWSDAARKRADLLVSLGSFTLAHALARLVAAEQIYRAFTILTGHPYHTGH
jgi:23S rRNA (pseudouridine1915-N3)-methyltransferase